MFQDATIRALNNEFNAFLTGYYQKEKKNSSQQVLFSPKSRNTDGVIRTTPISVIDSSAMDAVNMDIPISMCL